MDHLLSITLGGGEDFLFGGGGGTWGGYVGVLHGGVTWGCYMGVLHGFQGEQRGDQPLLKEHKGGGDYLALTDH